MSKLPKTYEFKRFTDSYIMMHRRIPKFLFWVMLLFSFVLIGLVVWSGFTTKPYIVKAQSLVTVRNKSYIVPSANGNIKVLNVVEGQTVAAGDILLVQESLELDTQIAQIQVSIDIYQKRDILYDRLIGYIQDDVSENQFNTNDEIEFYSYFSSYLNSIKQLDNDDDKAELKEQTLNAKRKEKLDNFIEIERLIAQKIAYEANYATYMVRANTSGIVHLNGNLHNGLFLQAGANIGTISNQDSGIILECYLSVADRAKVEVGNNVKFALSGLSQNEYGTLYGKIESIDYDLTSTDNESFFKAIIALSETEFHSKYGDITLFSGLQGETRVIYNETTYLKYFLEQLGIKIK